MNSIKLNISLTRYLQYCLGSAGIVLLICGLSSITLIPPNAFVPVPVLTSQFLKYTRFLPNMFAIDQGGRIDAVIEAKVTYPRVIYSNEAFVVKLDLSISKTQYTSLSIRDKYIPWGLILTPTTTKPKTDSVISLFPPLETLQHEIVLRNMESGHTVFILALADAIIMPDGPNAIDQEHRVLWSVKAKGPGRLNGFIKPTFRNEVGDQNVNFVIKNDMPINIEVKEPEDIIVTRKNIIAFCGSFMGSLWTLPGILAYIKQRREDRERKRKEKENHDATKPKIII